MRHLLAVLEVIFDTILPLRGRSARTKGRTAEEIPPAKPISAIMTTSQTIAALPGVMCLGGWVTITPRDLGPSLALIFVLWCVYLFRIGYRLRS